MANRIFIDDSAIGAQGSKIVTGAVATTGSFYAAQFITDCTPTVFTLADGSGTYSAIAYKAGTIVYGDITAITPAAGETVILYLR